MKAKKSLGQHFLKSVSILDTVVNALDPQKSDIVLEIGPGHGELTDRFIKLAGKTVIVEKDRNLIPLLKEKYSEEIGSGQMEVVEKDILEIDPEIFSFYKDLSFKIVGNIPYYITGAIIKKFLEAKFQPKSMVLLVQKEVAERIMAKDGKESILSLSVKIYGKPKIVKIVKRGSFSPPPKVDSAILLIDDINKKNFEKISEDLFFKIIKTGFSKKRKYLIRNLDEFGTKEKMEEIFNTCNISLKSRAEVLTLKEWILLVKKLRS